MPAKPLRLILLLALLLVQTAQAEVFRVFGAHDGFPKYFEEDGEAKGIVVDISKHCLNQMQVPYQIQLLPWKRAYTMAERSEGGVIGLSISDERLTLFDFSEPIFTEHIVLVVQKGREFPYQNIIDLKDKLIGATIGTSYGTAYDEAVANGTLTIVGFNDTRSGLGMLQRERIDAILLGSSVDIRRLAQSWPGLHPDAFTTLPVPFKSDSKHMGIAKALKMGWFLEQFNQCLKNGHDTGIFAPIIYQYSN
ncbi:ABC transporter substrate-binding protein [Pseudomonas sp.]|uniref:substrate-binding periplasmic protein n=1 Tax=Pseudomonas sp. TaxID=306 RepID=UPI0027343C45|nr:transporter substrate-binding domain-containing protein [Pseudomonas sp.]MDP2746722.1 transporter substrate-binding domain-containing protein [Pseudomonas sp.]